MSDEIMDVVDENDNIIGSDNRKNIHGSLLWHRGIHVILFNANGEMLLQTRGPGRDKYPDCYDLSVSEHVRSGETYDEAVARGLREELGIDAGSLKARPEKILHFRMNYGDPYDNMVGVLYKLGYETDGQDIRFDKEEIARVEFVSPEKVMDMIKDERNRQLFSFFTLEILRWYFGLGSKVQEMREGSIGCG